MQYPTILRYLFILLISLFPLVGQSQEQDTTTYLVITPGVDISQPLQPYINEGYNGFAMSLDVEYFKNIIFVTEFGQNTYNIEKDRYTYHSQGQFYKMGMDLNVLRENQQKNQVTLGFRYGHARYEHELERLSVISYWGNEDISLDREQLRSHWLEFTAGIRMELFANFYLGWSLRAQLKEKNVGAGYLPLYIPGYDKNRDNAVFGFTYSIYYKFFIPRKP